MAIVIYASPEPLEGSVEVKTTGWKKYPEQTVYVRAEVMEDEWPGPAVSKAKPRAKEMVLNAIPNKVIIEPKVKSE